jgi:hypothetical protein
LNYLQKLSNNQDQLNFTSNNQGQPSHSFASPGASVSHLSNGHPKTRGNITIHEHTHQTQDETHVHMQRQYEDSKSKGGEDQKYEDVQATQDTRSFGTGSNPVGQSAQAALAEALQPGVSGTLPPIN